VLFVCQQGMKDYELLCQGTAFCVSTGGRPSSAGGANRASRVGRRRPLFVTCSHVMAPWRWRSYFTQPWLAYVEEKHAIRRIHLPTVRGVRRGPSLPVSPHSFSCASCRRPPETRMRTLSIALHGTFLPPLVYAADAAQADGGTTTCLVQSPVRLHPALDLCLFEPDQVSVCEKCWLATCCKVAYGGQARPTSCRACPIPPHRQDLDVDSHLELQAEPPEDQEVGVSCAELADSSEGVPVARTSCQPALRLCLHGPAPPQ
jgi:hypothetical protein